MDDVHGRISMALNRFKARIQSVWLPEFPFLSNATKFDLIGNFLRQEPWTSFWLKYEARDSHLSSNHYYCSSRNILGKMRLRLNSLLVVNCKDYYLDERLAMYGWTVTILTAFCKLHWISLSLSMFTLSWPSNECSAND